MIVKAQMEISIVNYSQGIEIVVEDVRGSYQTIYSFHFQNVKCHSEAWPYTMIPTTDQTFNQTTILLLKLTFLPKCKMFP